MFHLLDRSILLRRVEPEDCDDIYQFKNDEDIYQSLGGFHTGFTRRGVAEWIDKHGTSLNEFLMAIINVDTSQCIGTVGLYNIDFRSRIAEFGVQIGNSKFHGKGIGMAVSDWAISYGFKELNLNRISLSVLRENIAAIALYEKLGFRREGVLRQAQFKRGQYLDLVCYSLLRDEYATEN